MTVPLLAQSPRSLTPAAAIAVGWFTIALGASALGVFHTRPGAPPVAIGLAAGAPPLAAITLAAWSPRFRAWATSLDPRFLTLLQTWRVAGLAFLALAAVRALPSGFAIPAGIGDVAIGLTAPLVASFVIGHSNRLFLTWTLLGIADLIAAVTLGVLYSNSPAGVLHGDIRTDLMATLPMSLIPAFGVPITLVAHALSLINLTGGRQAPVSVGATTGG
jgi:hypothetical protein